jgi:Kef-type K+ transport system membrane component KefB
MKCQLLVITQKLSIAIFFRCWYTTLLVKKTKSYTEIRHMKLLHALNSKFGKIALGFSALFGLPAVAMAASLDKAPLHNDFTSNILIVIAAILVAAKIFHLIEKIKQPPVVGELVAGISLGNLALLGFMFFQGATHHPVIEFMAELGVILLLFQIGLESNVKELTKVGVKSLGVGLIGAVVPFLLGTYVVGPLLLPGLSQATYLFLGASLAATSVGIAARIFKDLKLMKLQAAKIVIGAAVIDDILGLILLAVISGLVTSGEITVGGIGITLFKSFAFLFGSVAVGQLFAPYISRSLASINTGTGSKFTLAISFALFFAGAAQLIGLEPIIGAFAAGLALDPVHFKYFADPEIVKDIKDHIKDKSAKIQTELKTVLTHHSEHSIEDIINPLVLFFAPIFFVVTGMGVDIGQLLSIQTLLLAAAISIVAVFGKAISGFFLPADQRWVVGLAMVPRGEVGLIFAAIGQQLGVLPDQVFSVVVLTVLITTVVGPMLLTGALARAKSEV